MVKNGLKWVKMGGWGSEKGGEVILTGNTREGGGVKMGGKMRVF